MNLRNWKIGTRLRWAFGLMLALLVGSTIFSLSSLQRLNDGTADLVNDEFPKAINTYDILDIVNRNARAMRNMLLWDDPAEVAKERQSIANNKRENEENFARLKASIKSDAGMALLQDVMDARMQYGVVQKEFMELAAAEKKEEAATLLLTKVRREQRKYFDALRALVRHQTDVVAANGRQAELTYRKTRLTLLGLAALAFIVGSTVAILITRSIVMPLTTAVNVARTVAAGDLSTEVDVQTTDETGQLLLALKEMNDGLLKIVSDVRSGSEAVAAASAQIASGNIDLSSRTEQQASSLEEVAASMEELISTVKQNSDNAHHANGLAISASEIAAQGGALVSQVVDTMVAISASAKMISEIIGVIDGIAFQTNLLALNAAVEAARAGEQGRGFAVVANEVRNLAQRAAAASKEIRELIGDSVNKVDTGTKLVAETGATMADIVDSAKRVTDIMGEITIAGREQTAGIEQINRTIMQLDQATQKNAELVEEAAATSTAMQDQAASLAGVVGVFKIGRSRITAGALANSDNRPQPAIDVAQKNAPVGMPLHPPKPVPRPSPTTDDEWEVF